MKLRMKRWASLLLTPLLLLSLCPAASAADSVDARLEKVTQSVRNTLGLDTAQYDEFYGDVSEEELGTVWNLRWRGDGCSLNIEALENGAIAGYWRSDGETGESYTSALPTFPKVDYDAAKASAQAFLDKVLDGRTERALIQEGIRSDELSAGSCFFYGSIELNGLPSPLNWSVNVRGTDNVVTSFHRTVAAESFLGGVPSPKPAVGKDAAAQTLKDALKLELVYVRDSGETQAVLRYVAADNNTYYVDALTGKLLMPEEELYKTFGGAMPSEAEAAMDTGGRGLTAAERAGVEKLAGVLDKDALDRAVRAERAYMLDSFNLAGASYSLETNDETGEETVVCRLRYAQPESKTGLSASRVFTVDAKTGAVRSLYGYDEWDPERKPSVTRSDAQRSAEAFLKRFTPHAETFELYRTEDSTADGAPDYGFTFARKVNGCFFPENSCAIRINCATGAVCGLSYSYDENVTFDAPDGTIPMDAALDAWMDCFETVLAYRVRMKELSAAVPQEAKLISLGYTRFQTLALTYGLERDSWLAGLDAKTGLPVEPEAAEPGALDYADISGHWAAEEIETLAKYGVGYAAEAFGPDRPLTQWDLVCLLASAKGLRLDPDAATPEERNEAYAAVFQTGALTRAERSDDSAVDRMTLVKLLLSGAGYGDVARLQGIFTCSYADAASIPAEHLGYAALAQGLGLVRGSYNGSDAATRAVAAAMLCRLMAR